MRIKHLAILDQCVEEGCRYGLARAHKHTDSPSREHIEQAIYSAIMDMIHQYYDFSESYDFPESDQEPTINPNEL